MAKALSRNESATHPEQLYQHYLVEGSLLLGRLLEFATIVRCGDQLTIVAPLNAHLADQLCGWGGELEDFEPEPRENDADFEPDNRELKVAQA